MVAEGHDLNPQAGAGADVMSRLAVASAPEGRARLARLVRDHGGTIAVESGIGSGTTFTLRIPRLEKRIRALN